jgi:hypothetical protein
MKKRILYLNLYRKYFDDIVVGRKGYEFRKATEYWIKRLEGKTFDEIHFKNGYSKNAPFMKVTFVKITRRNIKAFGGDTFVIELGKILMISHYNDLGRVLIGKIKRDLKELELKNEY